MKIFVGISGASGVSLGLKLAFEVAKRAQTYVSISQNAKFVLQKEQNQNLSKKISQLSQVATICDDRNLAEPPSSGSFGINASIIAPCSINTVAKIHAGFADTLITRAAQVALKERKKLILAVREMPFSTITLEQITKLSTLGVVIAPPVLGYYAGIKNLEDMENFIIGKWLDQIGLENEIYKKWAK
ncbi:MAG: UbiX family flavin prenyltransferase [Campylobacter sp.]